MHDIRVLREQMDVLRDALGRRGALDGLGPVLERAERLERDRRTTIQAAEERKAVRNATSQEVAQRNKIDFEKVASDMLALFLTDYRAQRTRQAQRGAELTEMLSALPRKDQP